MTIEIDNSNSREYDLLSPETKQEFNREVNSLLKKTCVDEQIAKLNKIICQINNDHDVDNVNMELLLKLLPFD